MTTSSAEAVWEGGLKQGSGRHKARSGAFGGTYTFATRFEGAEGTNPEELLAAAEASCFSMALAGALEAAGTPATRITTQASCTVEKASGGFRISRIRLVTRGAVPGIDQAAFRTAAEGARQGCPVSQALQGNVDIELDAHLE